ncbi:hypothetical protein L6Q21_12545 [Sandaracinobacter sp. RS1-74]|uniref:hypothetical protein n=1 Tax=Sandaracinobacteroides sayramensis TaxID=2913411 RepID=UPI001EDC0967|nr:hypothetical protein [Sandaracinobacteroides sayramensis]MCG2841811.1 hypothetical protein [Sandaracinobacteroides sayramensis]
MAALHEVLDVAAEVEAVGPAAERAAEAVHDLKPGEGEAGHLENLRGRQAVSY